MTATAVRSFFAALPGSVSLSPTALASATAAAPASCEASASASSSSHDPARAPRSASTSAYCAARPSSMRMSSLCRVLVVRNSASCRSAWVPMSMSRRTTMRCSATRSVATAPSIWSTTCGATLKSGIRLLGALNRERRRVVRPLRSGSARVGGPPAPPAAPPTSTPLTLPSAPLTLPSSPALPSFASSMTASTTVRDIANSSSASSSVSMTSGRAASRGSTSSKRARCLASAASTPFKFLTTIRKR
mmetsp:Transcript_17189/g.60362  ORF Transcript_17189/g.60362 Transcript_17189/m.60362 type:complete len:247 (-) Transcript_17189:869-1609(-)